MKPHEIWNNISFSEFKSFAEQKMKFSMTDFFSKCDRNCDLNGKLHFLRSV